MNTQTLIPGLQKSLKLPNEVVLVEPCSQLNNSKQLIKQLILKNNEFCCILSNKFTDNFCLVIKNFMYNSVLWNLSGEV